MNRLISTILVVVGVTLIVLGVSAMDSFGSDVSRFFTGSPTDRSVWLFVGGVICAGIGLSGITLGGRKA
jgi:hypothetical protein